MKVKIKGKAKILGKLRTRLNRLKSRREEIFEKPLKPIIKDIRKNIIKDTINSTGIPLDHVITGNLLENTRYEAKAIKALGSYDFQYTIELGYFVEYGLNLEIGSNPKEVPTEILDIVSSDSASRESISDNGSRAYPIIRPVFSKRYQEYYSRIISKVGKQWR